MLVSVESLKQPAACNSSVSTANAPLLDAQYSRKRLPKSLLFPVSDRASFIVRSIVMADEGYSIIIR
jgi:hypothetical protein